MRPRLLHFVVGVVVVTAPLLPSTAGAESDASRARSWDRMIEPSAAARHRALADRRLERSRRTDPSAATGRAQSGVRDVRPVSRDTLQGPRPSERDTQVEPSIAGAPNDPSVVVGVVQQGRFEDGGSVYPGYVVSHDCVSTWSRGDLPDLTVHAVG